MLAGTMDGLSKYQPGINCISAQPWSHAGGERQRFAHADPASLDMLAVRRKPLS